MSARPIDDERARKRVEIGLSPQRPTANAEPLRPPDEPISLNQRRWLTALLGLAALSVIMLIWAQLIGSPTAWSQISGTGTNNGDESVQLDQGGDGSPWDMGALELGIYRMRTGPGEAGWNTLGAQPPVPYRVIADILISADTPDGHGGLIARHQDDENFYFFWVNGQGQFQTLLRSEGQLYVLQDWTDSDTIRPAGQPNPLAIEDNGSTLKFFSSDALLIEIGNLIFPVADVGVVSGAAGTVIAEIEFDRFEIIEE